MTDDEVPLWLSADERRAWEAAQRSGIRSASALERRADVDAAVVLSSDPIDAEDDGTRYVYISTTNDPDRDTAEPFDSEGWRVARAIAASVNGLPAALRALAEARAWMAEREDLLRGEMACCGSGPFTPHKPSCIFATMPRPK